MRRIVLAIGDRTYAYKLASYLREAEPEWETASFADAEALMRHLRGGPAIDALVGWPDMLRAAGEPAGSASKIVALAERLGETEGRWEELERYQPLPALAGGLRRLLERRRPEREGCAVVAVFSASGGAGKTTVALHLARQAGERGLRAFYLNLEPLNATALWLGEGEPDSLSRMMYALQAHPERWAEALGSHSRRLPQLRADFVSAPDHPGERLAMSPEQLEVLLAAIRDSGAYDVIVVDPDSGCGEWHRRLLRASDRIVWLSLDDRQCLAKSEKLLRHWREDAAEWSAKTLFALNKSHAAPMNRWSLPGSGPAAALPYVPQWKAMDQPGRLFGYPAFAGAVDGMLESLGVGEARGRVGRDRRRKEEADDAAGGARLRGAG